MIGLHRNATLFTDINNGNINRLWIRMTLPPLYANQVAIMLIINIIIGVFVAVTKASV